MRASFGTLLGLTAGHCSSRSVFFDLLEHDHSLASDSLGALARGLIQLLERKAKLGQHAIGQMRAVSGLGAAPVGA